MSSRHRIPLILALLVTSSVAVHAVATAAVPSVMSYSGELQSANGAPLAAGTYKMTFSLYTSPQGGTPIWTETQVGVEVVGGGFHTLLGRTSPAGLAGIPFDRPYYLGVRVGSDPEMSPRQQLVTLPFAFRAGLADQVADGSVTTPKIAPLAVTSEQIKSVSWDKITGVPSTLASTGAETLVGSSTGVPANVWSLKGNRKTASPTDFFGTTDAQPLVIKVNNATMMNFSVGGPISTTTGFEIAGDLGLGGDAKFQGTLDMDGAATFKSTLDVLGATNLHETLGVTGATTLGNTLDVTGATTLQNTLGVTGATSLGSTLGVTGATTLLSTLGVTEATSLWSTLGVSGATQLGNTLDVTGASTLQSTLGVTGIATFSNVTDATSNATGGVVAAGGMGVAKSLFVGGAGNFGSSVTANGALSSKSLDVTDSSTGYLATLTNTDGDSGDGIKIKLGKVHPAWDGDSYVEGVSPIDEAIQRPLDVIRGWIIEHRAVSFPSDVIDLMPTAALAGTICNLADKLFEKLNEELSLPAKIGPWGFDLPDFDTDCDDCDVPIIPSVTVIPALPDLSAVCDQFPSLSTPNLSFTDVSNSLTIQNEYLSFTDKDNRVLGAVRAESIEDWSARYVDSNYLINTAAGIVGIDLLQGVFGLAAGFSNLTKAYNQIGVEYMSGHGDYAEWLERLDPNERIDTGDIVAVRGGKITKNLEYADQVMAVSKKPIVLGNLPPAHLEGMGNKVAFVGQIPVKVMGPVGIGDYIVARSGIEGYGIGVKPADMTPEDLRLCVGRAWEANERSGPKLINTVVGVQNGDFARILRKVVDSNQSLEARMSALERRLEGFAPADAANATFKSAGAGR